MCSFIAFDVPDLQEYCKGVANDLYFQKGRVISTKPYLVLRTFSDGDEARRRFANRLPVISDRWLSRPVSAAVGAVSRGKFDHGLAVHIKLHGDDLTAALAELDPEFNDDGVKNTRCLAEVSLARHLSESMFWTVLSAFEQGRRPPSTVKLGTLRLYDESHQ